MKILIGNEKFKITKNNNNRFWNPLGMFYNTSEIEIEGIWYRCGTRFLKKNGKNIIQIISPMLVDEKTSIIKEFYLEGIYKEISVSRLKLYFIKYLLNQHSINHISFNIRKTIYVRRNTVFVFLIAFILSSIYYSINELNNSSLMMYIAENNWIQTIIIFLTISSFINIFYPFTLKKQIDKRDIETIAKETLEEERINKEIEKSSSF
jgi:hypothetical protein